MNTPSLIAWIRSAAIGLLMGSMAAVAQAEPSGLSTLEKLSQTSSISLGHRESSMPFSYYDARHQVVGYSHDLMLAAVERIRRELKLPALTIRLVPVTSQNRIPLVQNGSVDLECGSTTHNTERAKQVAFSVSIFQTSSRLLTRKDSGIERMTDIRGKRVVVTSGTTSERSLLLFGEKESVPFTLKPAKDHGDAFNALLNGEADAFMMDEAMLYGLRAKAEKPEDWRVVGEPMAPEVYACMMRKGDPAFKAAVDRSLAELMRSGEALKIYQRWFQAPIPPRQINLHWPAPAALLELYREPNDRPLD